MAIEKRDIEQATLAIFGLVVPAILGSSLTIFNDGDVHWHIAAGQWIIDHRAVPTVDPFSFTAAGKPWTAFEWGSQLIYGGAYRLAGFAGVAAVVTAALVAIHLTIVAEARRWIGPLGVAATIVLLDFTLIPMTLARPHLLAWVMLALWLRILMRARERSAAPPLAAALLMMVWSNLHGSFAIGLVIAALFALDACLDAGWRWPAVRGWLLFGVAATAAAMITPNGIAGFTHPLTVARMSALTLVVEWRPSSWDRTPFFFVALGGAAALMAWRGARLRPVIAGLLLLLAVMALHQMRHQAILAISAAMLLPRALSRDERPALFTSGARMKVAMGVAAAIAGLLLYRVSVPMEPQDNGADPRRAIAALPADLRHAPGLNGYSFGGPLILAGIRPYIDGRQDMYGDTFAIDYQHIVDGDPAAFDRAVARYDLRWVMIDLKYRRFITRLESDPAWRRIYADRNALIYRRKPSA